MVARGGGDDDGAALYLGECTLLAMLVVVLLEDDDDVTGCWSQTNSITYSMWHVLCCVSFNTHIFH